MTVLEKLLRHDAWTTRLLLTRCADLSDTSLDHPFDMGHRTLRRTFHHIIANTECWCDLILARPQRPITQTPADNIPALLARLDIVAPELFAFAQSFSDSSHNEAVFTDYLDNPPRQKSVTTALIHLATHGMHHRAQCLWMMRQLGLQNLPEGDPFSWENAENPERRETERLAKAHRELGKTLHQNRQFDAAAQSLQKAISLAPNDAVAHFQLGNIFKDMARLDEAAKHYRRAIAINPNDAQAHSSLICVLQFMRSTTVSSLRKETRDWDRRHARPLRKFIQKPNNDRSPHRRLKIGYVSADFHRHACALFIHPLLRRHDRKNFEIFCYAQVRSPDSLTSRFKSLADQWRDTLTLSDEEMAEQIRRDKIDILVDLKLHTAENRLLVFARKPAPVQVSWLGYPGFTGLSTIDYDLIDPHMALSKEKSMQLPETFWCYEPLEEKVPVNQLPAARNQFITFGCLNNFMKINEPLLRLWADTMLQVPNSRFLLMAPIGSCRDWVLNVFTQRGIDKNRIDFVDRGTRKEFLRRHHRIDIGLDCFPYNGHTTSLDSFWMGVPVVTLIGKTEVGRAGLTQLCNLGLKELAADTPKRFIKIATELANDISRLRKLRSTLRKRMQQSHLMNAPRFARNIEAAYRKMWHTWCVA